MDPPDTSYGRKARSFWCRIGRSSRVCRLRRTADADRAALTAACHDKQHYLELRRDDPHRQMFAAPWLQCSFKLQAGHGRVSINGRPHMCPEAAVRKPDCWNVSPCKDPPGLTSSSSTRLEIGINLKTPPKRFEIGKRRGAFGGRFPFMNMLIFLMDRHSPKECLLKNVP